MGAPKLTVGKVIAGRYKLVAPLSRGGMGSVWRAEHLSLGSPIAIKLIDPSLVDHDEPRARFEQEARAAAALRSPHVVQILDHGVDGDLPFIAMELLDGESLGARLHRLGPIPAPQLARIFQDIGRAMKKAHELGIIHRDLKPDNVFLVRNDDQEIAKVLDFGIAKAVHPLGQWKGGTRTGALIGTPQYMSPEQAQGLPVEASSDLWALGVIAFECVCGRLPFPSENPGALILQICANPMPVPSQIARVPARFDAWFARACQRDPRARFGSAKELADTLAEVLGGAPASADVSGAVAAITTGSFGPTGTHMPLAEPSPPLRPQPPSPSPEPPREALGEATMNGGAVVDSDPSTLFFVPASRAKKTLIVLASAAAALLCFALWYAMQTEPAGLGSAPDAASVPGGSPLFPSNTSPLPTPTVTPSPGPASGSASSPIPSTKTSASSSAKGPAGAYKGPLGAPSGSGTRTKDRIGF